ncbi:hypothetical protein [Hymenobacter sp.]|uniref:hypothetical protein n=1 Tax=Hymenobacter sp. TaxID=1898978 RepID=UPI002EDB9316
MKSKGKQAMSNSEIRLKLVEAVDNLTDEQGLKALAYVQGLLAQNPSAAPGLRHEAFLRHAGTIEASELQLIEKAIQEAHQIDHNEW